MTPLRKRMIEDLQLKGYSHQTQKRYLCAVQSLATHYRKSPADITEPELRGYFLYLAEDKRCARGTLKATLAGIKFCFATTLGRPWPVLGLIRARRESKLPVVLSQAEVRAIINCVRLPVYRVCLTTIYSCGLRISEGVALQVSDVDSQRMVLRGNGARATRTDRCPVPSHSGLAAPVLEAASLQALAFSGPDATPSRPPRRADSR